MRRLGMVLLGVAALALGAAGGCNRGERGPRPGSSTDGIETADKPIDKRLMLLLGSARAYHHQADVYIADGNPAKAIESVRKITELPFPTAAEAQEALDDAYARLAKLELAGGRVDEALKVAQDRLAKPAAESFFRSNLISVVGEIQHEQAILLDATDKERAKVLRQEALGTFKRSIEMNERLIETLAEEEP